MSSVIPAQECVDDEEAAAMDSSPFRLVVPERRVECVFRRNGAPEIVRVNIHA